MSYQESKVKWMGLILLTSSKIGSVCQWSVLSPEWTESDEVPYGGKVKLNFVSIFSRPLHCSKATR